MDFVHRSVVEGIAEVRIEREKVNALDDSLVNELSACFAALAEDPDVRGSILTGTGNFFSFGFDIPKFLSYPKEEFTRYLNLFTGLYWELFSHPKPIIAALNGHAVAGGCMLATACDIRIMVDGKAKIGLNEITFGSSIFAGSVAMLAFWVGERRAQEILYAGKLYSALEAHELGLVDAVVPDDQLLQTARQIAQRHAGKAPAAFRSIKTLLRKPVLEAMIAREGQSIEEFAEIWYSQETWKNLQGIQIRA
jgi:enoyl-CoA hydratase/carnithine racemase